MKTAIAVDHERFASMEAATKSDLAFDERRIPDTGSKLLAE